MRGSASRTITLKEEVRYVDRLLSVDADGTRFIDYLGGSEGEFDDPAGNFLFLQHHAELVRGKLAATTGRVREKFEWLAAYHNSVVADILSQFAGHRRSAEASWLSMTSIRGRSCRRWSSAHEGVGKNQGNRTTASNSPGEASPSFKGITTPAD